jgi:hypothetical protein
MMKGNKMSLDIFSAYATDESKEENGSWFDLGSGARVLVARAGNRNYGKALTRYVDEARLVLDKGDEAADKKSDEIMVAVIAETILKGWENISYKGKQFAYSIENAKTLLSHKEFRKQIASFADDFEAYKLKLEEEQGKA